jgi:hypothetical protein
MRMSRIEFRIRLVPAPPNEPTARGYRALDIALDGRSFLEFVRDAEAPFAAAEGHPDLAGRYEGLPAASVLPPSQHFWGKPRDELHAYGEKVALYDCECGCPGCWPLVVRITVAGQIVSWSDFEQPHRGPRSRASWWQYDGFGPFTFDRNEYEAALARAVAELQGEA